jgi:hypothetical protein
MTKTANKGINKHKQVGRKERKEGKRLGRNETRK